MEEIEEIEEEIQEPQKPDPQIEERARMQGWAPKEEFRGDPANWRPADEFVKRADEMMPILKSVNKKYEAEITNLKGKLSETSKMVQKMANVQSKYSDDFYDAKKAEIRTKKRQAAEAQEWGQYEDLEQQEAKLSKPEKIEAETPGDNENQLESVHPEIQRWMGENSTWWGNDLQMTNYAMFIGEQMKNEQNPLAQPGNEYAFCEEVKRQVQQTFPTKFQNPNRDRTDFDESNLRGGDNDTGGGNTWNDLPADAKKHCQKLMGEISGYTKEKYVKDYYEGE